MKAVIYITELNNTTPNSYQNVSYTRGIRETPEKSKSNEQKRGKAETI